ncbi:MAG TPA: hypothetical protein VKO45_08005 [Methanomicrobiales archaeon]|nr:hypothetical protein [Methanomicrobiales archaeon]
MVVRKVSTSDVPPVVPSRRDGSRGRTFAGTVLPVLGVILLAGLLACPAEAAFSMSQVRGILRIGDTITLSGLNTDNTTTFLLLTGPYLDEYGVMLTNTSALASKGYLDSVAVYPNYTWIFEWNTSLPEVRLNEGIYIVYASTVPLPRNLLLGHTYAQQTIYTQGSSSPVITPNATTPIPTPVPTWTPPPAGSEVQVSAGPSNDFPGRFDGDLIVYEAQRGGGDSDIYLYNITSGNTTAVATGPAIQKSPAVFGGTVVYSAYEVHGFNRTDADLYTYDVPSGVTKRISLPGDQLNPRIYGDLIAWQDESPGRSSVNVVLYDLGTQVKLKVPARTWAYSPDLSGGKVIWIDDPVAPAVFLYDIGEKTVRRVTNKTGIKDTPALDGDRITWADTRNDYAEIYALDIRTGTETNVTTDDSNHFTPAISGDRVVWVDFRNGNRDIYMYDLAARRETAVTTAEMDQVAPQIAGCTIAWADNRNGSFDVYYKELPGCTPSPTPAPVSLQPEVTGASTPSNTPVTPASILPTARTTAAMPPLTWTPPVSTTKSPGFGIFLALGAVGILFFIGRRKWIR